MRFQANIFQDGFKRISHWAFKGDAAAVELKDKLLNNDVRAGKRAEEFIREGEMYAKYGVTLEEAEEFRFNVYKDRDGTIRIIYWPRDPEEFDRVVKLLKEIGLDEEHFTAVRPEGGRQGRIEIKAKGREKLGELARSGNEKAQKFVRYLYAVAELKSKELLEDLKRRIGWEPRGSA